MRIALITETYFPQVNGVSRTLGELVRVLMAAGDNVLVVHPDYGERHDEAMRHTVRSIQLPFYQELVMPLPPFGRTKRAIKAFAPDIVHIATEATLGLSIHRWARRQRIPQVSSFHTNFDQYAAHYRVGWISGIVWRYLRWFHNNTIETYVPSNATIGELSARGLERLVLWPRGVHGDVFRPDRPARQAVRASHGFGPSDVVVGHVSRIAAEKNIGYLAEALEVLKRERPAAKVLIVGDGPARPALERRLGPIARFAGYRKGDELADHYSALDLFAFASLTETFGNVILEAMATALPVVAIRAGGPGETVRDGETGRLVEPTEPPEAMARRLITLVDDAEMRRRMGAAARAYAETQSWDAIMRTLRARYQAILDQNTSRGQ
jgi:glycosyltransferase involved in cell wall biosynthesis